MKLPAQIIDQESHCHPHQVTQKGDPWRNLLPHIQALVLFAEDTLSYPYACQVLLIQAVVFFFISLATWLVGS